MYHVNSVHLEVRSKVMHCQRAAKTKCVNKLLVAVKIY